MRLNDNRNFLRRSSSITAEMPPLQRRVSFPLARSHLRDCLSVHCFLRTALLLCLYISQCNSSYRDSWGGRSVPARSWLDRVPVFRSSSGARPSATADRFGSPLHPLCLRSCAPFSLSSTFCRLPLCAPFFRGSQHAFPLIGARRAFRGTPLYRRFGPVCCLL